VRGLKSVLLLLSVGLLSCEKEPDLVGNPGSRPQPQAWLIDAGEVFDGGPGKDGIPSVDDPEHISAAEATYLDSEDLVVGYVYEGEARAYPHKILDWHEIVNDGIGDNLFALTYCPLTGTAGNWNRRIEGLATTFGVSGLLYNSNLMPYDRSTESLWSQMRLDCVNGALIGNKISLFHSVETTWSTWKKMYPDTKVLSTNTGFDRNYNSYPYTSGPQDYRIDPFLLFPIDNLDNRLHTKERVLGVVNNGDVTAYTFSLFPQDVSSISIINDVVGGDKVAIIGSERYNFILAFIVEDQLLEPLSSLNDGFVKDQNENIYDPFGYVISGPDTGERLGTLDAYIGYWFAWAEFYPDIVIFDE